MYSNCSNGKSHICPLCAIKVSRKQWYTAREKLSISHSTYKKDRDSLINVNHDSKLTPNTVYDITQVSPDTSCKNTRKKKSQQSDDFLIHHFTPEETCRNLSPMNSAGIVFEHDFSTESTDDELFLNTLGFWSGRKDEIINENSSDNEEAKLSGRKFNPNTYDSDDFKEKTDESNSDNIPVRHETSSRMMEAEINDNKFNNASSTYDFDTNDNCKKSAKNDDALQGTYNRMIEEAHVILIITIDT